MTTVGATCIRVQSDPGDSPSAARARPDDALAPPPTAADAATSSDGDAAPVAPPDPFAALAAEVDRLSSRPIVDTGRSPGPRYGLWAIGLLGAVAIVVAVLALGARVAPPAAVSLPLPQDAVNDPCAARAAIIMRAVSAYVARVGHPPASLAALTPAELTVPPVDPVTGDPYGYEVQPGGAVTLSCPTAPPRE